MKSEICLQSDKYTRASLIIQLYTAISKLAVANWPQNPCVWECTFQQPSPSQGDRSTGMQVNRSSTFTDLYMSNQHKAEK